MRQTSKCCSTRRRPARPPSRRAGGGLFRAPRRGHQEHVQHAERFVPRHLLEVEIRLAEVERDVLPRLGLNGSRQLLRTQHGELRFADHCRPRRQRRHDEHCQQYHRIGKVGDDDPRG